MKQKPNVQKFRSFQRTEEETEWGHEGPTQYGGAAWPLATPPMCDDTSVHS
jgi:hypothetical protein